jgi:hypothetical protein
MRGYLSVTAQASSSEFFNLNLDSLASLTAPDLLLEPPRSNCNAQITTLTTTLKHHAQRSHYRHGFRRIAVRTVRPSHLTDTLAER